MENIMSSGHSFFNWTKPVLAVTLTRYRLLSALARSTNVLSTAMVAVPFGLNTQTLLPEETGKLSSNIAYETPLAILPTAETVVQTVEPLSEFPRCIVNVLVPNRTRCSRLFVIARDLALYSAE